MIIRVADHSDFEQIWPIFHEITQLGDTYAYDVDTDKEQARAIWMDAPQQTYVAEDAGQVIGTYFLKPNQAGPGNHVCNCGYMVSSAARGRGVASAMCAHSQTAAAELGYRAMQFNVVASTNKGAVRLWAKAGFEIVGTLPKAFNHPTLGYVDAYIMYKPLLAS